MDKQTSALKEQLVKSFFRLKHLVSDFHADTGTKYERVGISIAELVLMKEIQNNSLDSKSNTRISDIQNLLCISKAGVSKMLDVLAKKDYIARDIDKNNRRTLIVTLTQSGRQVLSDLEENTDQLFANIIHQLGQEQSRQFVELVNKFVDVTDDALKSQRGGELVENANEHAALSAQWAAKRKLILD